MALAGQPGRFRRCRCFVTGAGPAAVTSRTANLIADPPVAGGPWYTAALVGEEPAVLGRTELLDVLLEHRDQHRFRPRSRVVQPALRPGKGFVDAARRVQFSGDQQVGTAVAVEVRSVDGDQFAGGTQRKRLLEVRVLGQPFLQQSGSGGSRAPGPSAGCPVGSGTRGRGCGQPSSRTGRDSIP